MRIYSLVVEIENPTQIILEKSTEHKNTRKEKEIFLRNVDFCFHSKMILLIVIF